MSHGKHSNGRKITVGNIENSTGIAIGDGTYVAVNQSMPSAQEEISALLDEFIISIGRHGDSLSDAQGVRQAAETLRAEVARPSPKWQTVRRMLTTVAASVGGVAALTGAINNIQALVAHIID